MNLIARCCPGAGLYPERCRTAADCLTKSPWIYIGFLGLALDGGEKPEARRCFWHGSDFSLANTSQLNGSFP